MSYTIYAIHNHVSGNVYVGQTRDSYQKRWKSHLSRLNNNSHHNRHLQNAWNKYGKDAFRFVVYRNDILTKEELDAQERYYISLHEGRSYNMTVGGEGSILTEAQKAERRVQRKLNPEEDFKTRLSMSKIYLGFVAPDGTPTPIVNLDAFCKRHGLMINKMRYLISGERNHHKGWTYNYQKEILGPYHWTQYPKALYEYLWDVEYEEEVPTMEELDAALGI